MKFCLVVLILLPGLLLAQTPMTEAEFRRAFLRLDVKEKKEDEAREKIRKSIEVYLENVKRSISTTGPTRVISTRAEQELMGMTNKMRTQLNSSFDLGDVPKFVTGWVGDVSRIRKNDLEILRNKGVLLPEDYLNHLSREAQKLKAEIETYNKADELIVVSDYLQLEEVSPDAMLNLQQVSPGVKSLSLNVGEVILKLHQSGSFEEGIEKVKERSKFDGQEELIKFWQILSLVDEKKDPCWQDHSLEKLNEVTRPFQGMTARHKEGRVEPDQFLLAVNNTDPKSKKLSEIESYKFTDGGKTYYLFERRKNGFNEESWVMGVVDEKGQMTFRYFRLIKEQNSKLEAISSKDIPILKARTQENVRVVGKDRFYIQAQEGLVIKQDKIEAPLIGEAYLPRGKVVIGQVHMAYLSDKNLTQSNLNFNHDGVSMQTQFQPVKRKWALGAGMNYSPLSGKMGVNGNVRVENLTVGYGANLKGGESGANMSYILSRNFVTMTSNFKSNPQVTLGRQFKKGKGFVSASTDLHKFSEVKLVIFMDNFLKR